jgi:TPR repeat protein
MLGDLPVARRQHLLCARAGDTGAEDGRHFSEALFLRACRLGITSGCTNRAAGMTHLAPETAESNACAARTLAQTCRRDDPWGCTMYGYHLMRGAGVQKDPDLAIRMFRRACRINESFAACTKAKLLLKKIEDERGAQPESPD